MQYDMVKSCVLLVVEEEGEYHNNNARCYKIYSKKRSFHLFQGWSREKDTETKKAVHNVRMKQHPYFSQMICEIHFCCLPIYVSVFTNMRLYISILSQRPYSSYVTPA